MMLTTYAWVKWRRQCTSLGVLISDMRYACKKERTKSFLVLLFSLSGFTVYADMVFLRTSQATWIIQVCVQGIWNQGISKELRQIFPCNFMQNSSEILRRGQIQNSVAYFES